jgi:hypothetical protein
MVFILSNQNFPPVVHCDKGLNCPKIIRIENGSNGELVRVLVDTVPSVKISLRECHSLQFRNTFGKCGDCGLRKGLCGLQ